MKSGVTAPKQRVPKLKRVITRMSSHDEENIERRWPLEVFSNPSPTVTFEKMDANVLPPPPVAKTPEAPEALEVEASVTNVVGEAVVGDLTVFSAAPKPLPPLEKTTGKVSEEAISREK